MVSCFGLSASRFQQFWHWSACLLACCVATCSAVTALRPTRHGARGTRWPFKLVGRVAKCHISASIVSTTLHYFFKALVLLGPLTTVLPRQTRMHVRGTRAPDQ